MSLNPRKGGYSLWRDQTLPAEGRINQPQRLTTNTSKKNSIESFTMMIWSFNFKWDFPLRSFLNMWSLRNYLNSIKLVTLLAYCIEIQFTSDSSVAILFFHFDYSIVSRKVTGIMYAEFCILYVVTICLIHQALEMIHNIREAFNELLEENDWMDDETRAVAREKVCYP